MIRPLPHIAAMEPYALAALDAPQSGRTISLSQNESLRPPSPAVEAALRAIARSANLYPDPDWTALRRAIARVYPVSEESILCGAGSLDLIAAIARTYADADNAVLTGAHAYPFFRTAAALAGAPLLLAPEADFTVSVDALLDAADIRTRIVFVANPANPTGTRLPSAELRRLRAGLPGDVLLVIDEAYGEFADGSDAPVFDLAEAGNTVVLRTFSKAYGLAGLRIGWGAFPPAIAREVRKGLNPNNLSAASQAAAIAALEDQDYMGETCRLTAAARDRFAARLGELGFATPQSHANFVLIPFQDAEDAEDAAAALAWLKSEGVLLRSAAAAGLPHCLRATVGDPADMERTAELLGTWRQQRRAV